MSKPEENGVSRRSFLKTTALGALAFGSVPAVFLPRNVEAYEPGARVHPNIDRMRVVGVHDPAMTTEQSVNTGWQVRDPMVGADVVDRNMDRMAMALTGDRTAGEAWKAIFLKPPGKSWSDVVVAIKSNQIAQQRTRSAVMSKLCRVLTERVGVKAPNIHVYDACHGGSMPGNVWDGLPEGVKLESKWGGFSRKTNVPAPFFDGEREISCMRHLVSGEVDILINIALCKGHGSQFGRFTQSMKNHFGTFSPRERSGHGGGDGPAFLIGINKTPEILGRMDAKSGKVLFPRQQLTIIDALWASDGGPGGLPDAQPNTLFMGTFNPVVDTAAALKLRRDRMNWRVNENYLKRWEQEFGYKQSDIQLVDALKATA